MISYDSYKNRIEKVAKVKAFVVKFKFLIIGVLALLIAGISGLLATKGMVTTAMSLPAQVTYGEDYSPIQEAEAFLSSVSYEYTVKGKEEWSEEKPLKVGTYLARAVTNKTIGKGYGDPVEFEILKKEATLTIKSDTMTYGDGPECELDGIVTEYGDRIVSVGSTYNLPKADESFEVDVTVGRVIILDKNGNDSSDCYDYEPVTKKITINKRILNVKPVDVDDTYSGKPVEADIQLDPGAQQTVHSNGDKITFSHYFTQDGATVSKPENAGIYGITLNDINIKRGDIDVTHLYEINNANATLRIAKKRLKITTGGLEITYDGKEHSADTFTQEGLIEDLHTIRAEGSAIVVKNVTDEKNIRTFTVWNGTTEVTQNYDMSTPTYGDLIIHRKKITVTTGSKTGEYDGTVLYDDKLIYNLDDLAEGQEIVVSGFTTITDVSQTKPQNNTVNYDIKVKGTGEQVTANYDITNILGTLTVTARPLKITTYGDSKTYDGNSLTKFEYSVIYFGSNSEQTEANAFINYGEDVILNGALPERTDVGTTENKIPFTVPNPNYEIKYESCVYGALEITKRNITVKLKDYSAVYGESYTYSTEAGNYDNTAFCDLAAGERLTVTNVSYEFGANPYPDVRAQAYSVTSQTAKINSGLKDTTANYNITYIQGSLTVTQRNITVKILSAEKEYDGTALTSTAYAASYKAENDGLVNGYTLTVVENSANGRTVVGSEANTVSFTANGNYALSYDLSEANLTITARNLALKSRGNRWTYNGKENFEEGYDVVEGSVAPNQKVIVTSHTTVKNFADSPKDNVLTYDIVDASNVSVLSNYDLDDTACGTLEIIKKAITIKSDSATKEYDGTELSCDKLIYNEKDLVDGQEIVIDGSNSIVNAYDTDEGNNLVFYDIKVKATGEVVTANYDITEIYGTLTVTSRPLKVITDDDSKPYDGTPLTKGTYKVIYFGNKAEQTEANAFVKAGDSLRLTGDLPSITDFGTIKNAIPLDVYNSNYAIKATEHGTLEITKRNITVQLNTYSVTYGDVYAYETVEANAFTVTDGSLVILPEGAEQFEITGVTYEFGTVKYPAARDKAYAVVLNAYKISKVDGTDGTGNYKVTVVDGALTIEKRKIEITSNDNGWTYDNKDHFEEGYDITVGTLPDGQEIKVTSHTTVKTYAESPKANVLTYDILHDGASVITNYDLSTVEGTLTINQRHIAVKTQDKTKTYDGTPLTGGGIEKTWLLNNVNGAWVDGGEAGLLGNDGLVIDETSFLSITNVAESRENSFYYSVPNDNYVIEYGECEYGELTIIRANLTVTLKSYSVTYGDSYEYPDGEENYQDVTGLISGEALEITGVTFEFGAVKYPDVREKPYAVTGFDCKITKQDGSDSTGNYKITPIDGELTITKRSITITTPDVEFTYNGAYQKDETVITEPSAGTLPDGQSLALRTPVEGQRNAGVYIGGNTQEYGVYYGGKEVTENYDITENFGTLRINARKVSLTVDDILSGVKYGDGFKHTLTVGGDGLAEVDGVEEKVTFTVTYEKDGESLITAINAGTYTVKLYAYLFFYADGTAQSVQNYIVTATQDGTLVINKRQITVTLENIEREYGEISGLTLNWNKSTENDKEDGTGIICGKINEFISISGDGFAYGENIVSLDWYTKDKLTGECISFHSVDDYVLQIRSIYVINSDGESINIYVSTTTGLEGSFGNYIVTIANTATLTIKPKEIKVEINDLTVTYGENPALTKYPNGLGNYKNAATLELAFNEKLELSDLILNSGNDTDDKLNAGAYDITSAKANFFNSDGTPIEKGDENYTITFVKGTLTVNKKTVNLTFNKAENDGEMYGKQLSYIPHTVTGEDFVYGQSLELHAKFYTDEDCTNAVVGLPKDAGAYYYAIDGQTSKIFDGNGQEVKFGVSNYDFKGLGTAAIQPKKIELDLGTLQYIYGDTIRFKANEYCDLPEAASELEYGESLQIAVYYLREITGGYSIGVPKNVGTYEMVLNGYRIDGKQSGNYDVDLTGKVEITKREITVNAAQLGDFVYGEDTVTYPSDFGNHEQPVGGDGLAPNQQLKVTGVEYYKDGVKLDGVPTEVGTYIVKACEAEIYEDSTKVDVAKNYDVTYGSGTEFKITARNVKVIVGDKSFVYDGKAHSYTEISEAYFMDENGYAVRPLTEAEKSEITVKLYKQITHVWESGRNIVEFYHANYSIEAECGNLNITKRPVTATSESKTFVYDGEEHDCKIVSVENYLNVVTGLKEPALVDETMRNWTATPVVNVGEGYDGNNTFEIVFLDETVYGDGHTIGENYKITYAFGTIAVTPRTITVVTGSALKHYDGTALSTADFERTYYVNDDGDEEDGLLGDDAIKANGVIKAIKGKITELYDAGEKLNETLFEVVGTENYEIVDYDNGTLTVEQIALHLVLNKGVTSTYGKQPAYALTDGNYSSVAGLITGEVLAVAVKYYTADDETLFDSVRNVGKYFVTPDWANSFVKTGRYDESGLPVNGVNNYILTFEDGDVEIIQKEITVELLSYAFMYGSEFDGYESGKNNFYEADKLLAYGEELEITVNYFDADGNPVELEDIRNVGAYTVKLDTMTIYNADGTLGDIANYKIVGSVDGEITVTKRDIFVDRLPVTQTYCGEWIEARGYDTYAYDRGSKVQGLVYGDTLEVVESSVTRLLNAGRVEITTAFTASENYNIKYGATSYLTVNRVQLTIELNDIEGVTYGKELKYDEGIENYNLVSGELVKDEKLEIKVTFYLDEECTNPATPKDAGEYWYAYTGGIITGKIDPETGVADTADGINNYTVTATPAAKSAVIEKKDVTISLKTPATVTYDGETRTYADSFSPASCFDFVGTSSLEYGEGVDEFGVTYYLYDENGELQILDGLPKDAGKYYIEFNVYSTIVNGDRNITDNYTVYCDGADGVDFEILKASLTVVIGNGSKTYDGEEYVIADDTEITFEGEGLVGDETLVRNVKYRALKDGDGNALGGDEIEGLPVDAGTYGIVFDRDNFEILGGKTSNYEVKEVEENATLIIAKRVVVSVTVEDRKSEIPPEQKEIYTTLTADGSVGITDNDRAKLKPFYTYRKEGGTEVIPFDELNEIGKYTVELSFTAGGTQAEIEENVKVLKNYELPALFVAGTLTLTARQVTVKPVYSGAELTYDGTEVDLTDPDWADKFTFANWHTTEKTEEGFLDGFESGLTPVFKFTLNGKEVEKPCHAGTYSLTVSFEEEIPATQYEVEYLPLEFTIQQKELTFNLAGFDETTKYGDRNLFDVYPEAGILALVSVDGFIDGEQNLPEYVLSVEFRKDGVTGAKTLKDFAGTYAVVVAIDEKGDYFINYDASESGSLVVEKYVIYVKANSKTELYAGQKITLGANDFTIIGGENGKGTTSLVNNDRMTVTSFTPNELTSTSFAVTVFVNTWRIVNGDGRVVNDCYDVKTRYSSDMDGYNAGDFAATISYKARTVYYKQAEADLADRTFDYTGNVISPEFTTGTDTWSIVDGKGDGFIDDHKAALRMTVSSYVNPGKYTKWVILKAVDGSGKDVSMFYNFVVDNVEESQIIISAVEVKLTVKNLDDAKLQAAWDSKDTSVLTPYIDNVYILNSDFYTAAGLWEDQNHTCEIAVVKNADGSFTFMVMAFQLINGNKADKSVMYSLKLTKPAGLSAQVQLTHLNNVENYNKK